MSNSNQEYITRDFYDSNMREFKESVHALIAAADARFERIAADMRVENEKMRTEFRLTQQRLDSMDKRIDNIERSQDRFFRNMGFALTGMTLFFTAVQVLLTFIK